MPIVNARKKEEKCMNHFSFFIFIFSTFQARSHLVAGPIIQIG